MVHLQGSQPGGQFLHPSQGASQQESAGQQSQSQPFREHFLHSQGSQPDSDFRQSLHFSQDFLQASIEHLHGSHPGGQLVHPSQEALQQSSLGQQSQSHPFSDFGQSLHSSQVFMQPFMVHLQGSQPGGQFLQPSQEASQQVSLGQQSQSQPFREHFRHSQGSQPDSDFRQSLHFSQDFLQASIEHLHGSHPGGQ